MRECTEIATIITKVVAISFIFRRNNHAYFIHSIKYTMESSANEYMWLVFWWAYIVFIFLSIITQLCCLLYIALKQLTLHTHKHNYNIIDNKQLWYYLWLCFTLNHLLISYQQTSKTCTFPPLFLLLAHHSHTSHNTARIL